ncbi:MAG: DUF1800 family protein [Opitutaceae bacterium]|nr:DUF1800 family protein [Opitutaceae bacterium]
MKTSRLVPLALAFAAPLAAQTPSVSNLSTRAQVGTAGDILISGFNIGPGGGKQVLIRASGPALAAFGVGGALADPQLELFSGQTSTARNDNWNTPIGGATPVTAANFTAVGAFAFPAGSRDAALLVTLAPGPYTAQVSGVGGGTGVSLIEVYEVGAGGARLTNISTRAQVGTGANMLIPGLVISPGATPRRLLIRAAGPSLGALGVPGVLADPTLLVLDRTGATVASNNDWGTPVGSGAASAAVLGAAFPAAGAFNFNAGSRDSAILADFSAGSYSIQVSGVGGTTGVALVEVYDVTPVGETVVSIAATRAAASENGTQTGEFTITRAGDTFSALTVNYGVGGSATNAIDYPPLLGTVVIPAGAASVTIPLVPLADTVVEPTETVTLTLGPGPGYALGSTTSATVSVADSPGTLYVATLRPASGATSSAASGLATIVLSANGQVATVTLSFSNLSSAEVGAHLFLGNSTSAGDYVLNLPLGQVSGAPWTITATGTYDSAQILEALRTGRIFVGVDTVNHPAGELRGAFLTAVGSQNFVAPAAPPAVALTNVTPSDAARFLMQATFGPRKSEIDSLTGGSISAWIDAQLTMPASLHRPAELAEWNAAKADAAALGRDPSEVLNGLAFRRRAWHQVTLAAPDQLRQRMAFALSQILVVSDDPFGVGQTEGLANYYDVLVNGAFGNFRALLEQVTLNPIMGAYLSSLRNGKADPVTGTFPDENYAREVMQLFTIGLVQLQPDGTLRLDEQGLPIPTYNQTTITQMARIFTGWGFFNATANATNSAALFRGTRPDYINPMMLYAVAHEPGAKDLSPVLSTIIPANLGGTEDLKRALDALFNHANTPAFISRQLIQRLVTDNPSPAYVWRVAEKFRNNGAGVRGDLAAVVRAILTDYEARSPAVFDDPGYGKLKEPLLRLTALLRGFNAVSTSGRNTLEVYAALNQGPLESPTVFNFFEPGYVYPGPLAAAGLVAPEFQITNDTTAITVPNYLRDTIFRANNFLGTNLVLNLSAEQALLGNVPALLDHLGLILAGGQLSAATRTRITTALAALPAATSTLERAQTAVLLVATSLDGSTQK